MSDESFAADLEALGFRLVQDRGAGVLQYSHQPTRYLMLWITKLPPATDGSGKFQVSIGEITVRVQ